ncbi:MAG: NeuD/PglB/VioB family sugar acetyltransferase [Dehalococcoidia bacterium]
MGGGTAPVVLLMGRGGQARVVLDAALAAGIEVTHLLDDSGAAEHYGIAVCGPPERWTDYRGASFIVAMSDARRRAEIGGALLAAGEVVLNVVHPGAYVSPRAHVGVGVCVMHGVTVHVDARLGDFSIVNANASIDHDNVLGVGVSIGPGVTFPGHVTAGDFSSVGAGVVARPGTTIGAGATVGAGAVLVKDVPPGEVWAGNPARRLDRTA